LPFERVKFDPDIRHLLKDPEFRRKLSDRIDRSNGWGFTIRYKGLRVSVTAIGPDSTRQAYLEA